MSNQALIKEGSTVKLKASVRHVRCPEGREDNHSAKVRTVMSDGRLMMDQDLRGCKHWNIEDVELAASE
ncbi:hypothetical protein RYA05_01725 [Pseudomonas syringae pv. actinidiae]|nr:hypothetical protein [Pseudomonas syringae pv. actinidiae]